MSDETDRAKARQLPWLIALLTWTVLHIAFSLFVPSPARYVIEPGWWLAVYFAYRIGRATQVGGGQ